LNLLCGLGVILFVLGILIALLFGNIQLITAIEASPAEQATQVVSGQLTFSIVPIIILQYTNTYVYPKS